jgi:hypothetical protein
MSRYTSTILQTTVAVGICYFVLIGGGCLPILFAQFYGIHNLADVSGLMPAPTRFAVEYRGVAAAAVILTAVISIILSARYPVRHFQFAFLGLCSQGILLWLFLFGFFYMGFYSGPISLHHDPEFDFGAFYGFFPFTLAGLLAAFITSLFAARDETRQNA